MSTNTKVTQFIQSIIDTLPIKSEFLDKSKITAHLEPFANEWVTLPLYEPYNSKDRQIQEQLCLQKCSLLKKIIDSMGVSIDLDELIMELDEYNLFSIEKTIYNKKSIN